MKIYSYHLFFAVFSMLALVSCNMHPQSGANSNSSSRLFAVQNKEEFYGYVNEVGDTVIPCELGILLTDTIVNIGFIAKDNKCLCINNKAKVLFQVFIYDNGPDEPSEGLFRMIGENGLMGYADTLGHVVIPPKFKFTLPFKNGKAKVTDEGYIQYTPNHEHYNWISDHWYYIDHRGTTILSPQNGNQ